MVSPAMLIVALVIAIAIILFCIIVLKLNASIGMVLASLFMGVAGGLDLRLRQHDDQHRPACRLRHHPGPADE